MIYQKGKLKMVSLTGAVAAYKKTVVCEGKLNLILFWIGSVIVVSLPDCEMDVSSRDVSRL